MTSFFDIDPALTGELPFESSTPDFMSDLDLFLNSLEDVSPTTTIESITPTCDPSKEGFSILLSELDIESTALDLLPESVTSNSLSVGSEPAKHVRAQSLPTQIDSPTHRSHVVAKCRRRRFSSPVGKRPVQRNTVMPESTDKLPEALPPLDLFRIRNGYSMDSFLINGCQPAGEWSYEINNTIKFTPYTPRIFRYPKADEPFKAGGARGISGREGLCPYCVSNSQEMLFFDMNSSQYSTHLLGHHGIFTTGSFVRDPVHHCYGIELKKGGRHMETECITCPYDDCGLVIKVSKKREGEGILQQRLSAYIRHVAQSHKDRKNKLRSLSNYH